MIKISLPCEISITSFRSLKFIELLPTHDLCGAIDTVDHNVIFMGRKEKFTFTQELLEIGIFLAKVCSFIVPIH
jgi:hypothetical protein